MDLKPGVVLKFFTDNACRNSFDYRVVDVVLSVIDDGGRTKTLTFSELEREIEEATAFEVVREEQKGASV